MASNIRGITVKLNADTTALTSALKDVNKKSRDIGRELRKVNRSLRFNPENTELLAQKQDLLAERVEATKEKLETLQRTQKDVDKQFQKGELPEEKYRAFKREVIETENKLEYFNEQMEETAREARRLDSKMKAVSDRFETTGNRMKNVGDSLNTNVTLPLMAAFTALTVGTRDFRKEISVLENNAKSANVEMETMDKYMAQMSAVTGDLNANVEGLSNLLAAGFRGDQFKDVMDELAGAALKFKETIKFENVAEGLQETLGSGQAVGQFGELLERSGIQLDKFEKGLEKAKEQGREHNYVLQTLAKTGLAEVYEQYKKNNEELVNSAEAYYDLQSSLADLGEELEPIMTRLVEGTTDVVDAFNDLSEEQQDAVLLLTGIAAAAGPVLSVTGNLALTISSLTGAIAGAGGLTAALSGLEIAFGVFGVGGVIAGGLVYILSKIKDIRDEAKLAAQDISNIANLQEAKEQLEAINNEIKRLEDQQSSSILGPKVAGDIQPNSEQLKKLKQKKKELKEFMDELKEDTGSSASNSSDGYGNSTKVDAGPTDAEQFKNELDKAISDYNFKQKLSEMSSNYKKEIAKLQKEMKNKINMVDTFKISDEKANKLKGRLKNFYNNQIADVITEAKDKSLKLEEQYQDELAIMQKEGLEKELERLDQQEEKELKRAGDAAEAKDEIREKYRIKRQKAREKYSKQEKAKQDQLMANRYKLNDISLKEYKAYLQERLNDYRKYSDEYIKIKQRIDNLELTTGEVKTDYESQLEDLKEKNEVYGESFDFAAAKAKLLKSTINQLIAVGKTDSKFFKQLQAAYEEITSGDQGPGSLNWMTDTFVKLGYEVEEANNKFKQMRKDMVNGLSNAIAKGKDLGDVFNDISQQLKLMVAKQVIVKPLVDWGLKSLGLPSFHEGGFVDPKEAIQKYHSGGSVGLKNDEVPAILQTGEYVLSRDQVSALKNNSNANVVSPKVDVQVVNNTGTPVQTRKKVQFDGTRTIVKLFMDGYARNVEGVRDIINQRR